MCFYCLKSKAYFIFVYKALRDSIFRIKNERETAISASPNLLSFFTYIHLLSSQNCLMPIKFIVDFETIMKIVCCCYKIKFN